MKLHNYQTTYQPGSSDSDIQREPDRRSSLLKISIGWIAGQTQTALRKRAQGVGTAHKMRSSKYTKYIYQNSENTH